MHGDGLSSCPTGARHRATPPPRSIGCASAASWSKFIRSRTRAVPMSRSPASTRRSWPVAARRSRCGRRSRRRRRPTSASSSSGTTRWSTKRRCTSSRARTVVEFTQLAGDSGLARYCRPHRKRRDRCSAERRRLRGRADRRSGHACSSSTARRRPPLRRRAAGGGITVDVVAPAAMPALDQLATYTSTVLVDVDATVVVEGTGAIARCRHPRPRPRARGRSAAIIPTPSAAI